MNKITRVLLAALMMIGIVAVTSAQASASTSSGHWARSTIYIQNASPTSPWSDEMLNRVQYYRTLGVHYNLVNGKCVSRYPCIVIKAGNYGDTGWEGLTTFAHWCGTTTDPWTWCNYTGVSGTWTVARINTYYAESDSVRGKMIISCHELAHALANFNHSGGPTCLWAVYNSSQSYTLQSSEVTELRDKFWFTPFSMTTDAPEGSDPSTDPATGAATGDGPDTGTGLDSDPTLVGLRK